MFEIADALNHPIIFLKLLKWFDTVG